MLSYRDDPTTRPRRPMLRILRAGGVQDIVLPGVAQARAHWLGLLPADTREIRLAAEPGFVLERVGRRSEAGLLLQALRTRPLRAVSALYERIRGDGRRHRDTLRGACAVTPRGRFAAWAAARSDAAFGPGLPPQDGPAIRLLVLARDGDAAPTLTSLRAQTHRGWRAVVLHAGEPPGAADDPRIAHEPWRDDRPLRGLCADDALCLLEAGDRLMPDALALLASGLADADLVYADEVRDGVPRLKPDWSPDLARATGYHGRPWLASTALLARLPDEPAGPIAAFALGLDLALAGAAARVAHIPRVLAQTIGGDPDAPARAAALSRHRDTSAEPVIRDGVADLLWPLPQTAPLASIVIPSRDRLDLIERVCRGVLHETDYPAIECIIVDNGSTDPAVLAHYAALRRDPRVRIVPFDAPFNFSAMVNAGVAAATGAVAVLLNNDVAVLRPDWLDALVRQAVRPEVGAVGAKLLYADGTLQHAGVVVGLGGRAGHILRRRPADSPGHLGQMRVAHEVSAVTAACLAVARDIYRAVGGFDAATFPIDFNDVDFCLRLKGAGYKTVWTPAATLAHRESVSRGPATGAARVRFEQEAARFSERWRDVIRHDPFYHPALSLTTFGEDLE
ncbi:glycosyltransferase family 2 protein [uncultured Methylobacterium sp.]|uniref:glycosyltransferase family 2 protein n=1 Tax=uncultured Methylobacterium sp. TaxID=157278 RepID=UPI0035C955E2